MGRRKKRNNSANNSQQQGCDSREMRVETSKQGDNFSQQTEDRSGSFSSGRRRKKKDIERDITSIVVKNLRLNIAERDNTVTSNREEFQVALVDFLQQTTQSIYPDIGRLSYRVPDVHINRTMEEETSEEGVSELAQLRNTEARSDRAHSLVCDAVSLLSQKLQNTSVGPFFIISSYAYDNFLSRLKASFDEVLCPKGAPVRFPEGSGLQRVETDILIVALNHIIFMEVKATGDNFDEYESDKVSVCRKNMKKAAKQLDRDEKVFNHVMADLELHDFRRTKIAAFPNLNRELVSEALKDSELKEICHDVYVLSKDDLPENHLKVSEDFRRFYSWWNTNIFPDMSADNVKETPGKCSSLEKVKIIVGRYVGFMSVVSISNHCNTKLHRIGGLVEGRRKGQAVWYVGERFAYIVLTPEQRDFLSSDVRLGYLSGPPGSGKTIVLSQRARRWIQMNHNFVVVINMYRGAPGRAIGRKIYQSITENRDTEKAKLLMDHTIEIGVDVSVDRFDQTDFLAQIRKAAWPDLALDLGRRVLFVVDETYVQSYWNPVFKTLRETFPQSALWCAGLYGKQPQNFTLMKLTKVIRCPPNIQNILSLVDWVEERKICYVLDSTTACLPSNGPHVLTIRHHEHAEFSSGTPMDCLYCGNELAQIFQRLHLSKPGQGHTDPDLQQCSLSCSEVVILVNMPRSLYNRDAEGYLDTSVTKFRDYMSSIKNCRMLQQLIEAGYPTRVHTSLACHNLIASPGKEVINVTWIYTYQGLENKVIIFLPGDEAIPENMQDEYLIDPLLNIPCPGLMGSSDDNKEEDILQDEESEMMRSGLRCDSFGSVSESGGETERGSDSDTSCRTNSSSETADKRQSEAESSLKSTMGDSYYFSIDEHFFNTADLNRFTRWDKSNLFIAASRCMSQLILLTR